MKEFEITLPRLATEDFERPEDEQALGSGFAATIKSIMAGNFFISLLLASALQYLWGMVNALQMIVFAVFFNLLMPSNVQTVEIQILKACSFDLFQTELIYTEIFGFMESDDFSEKFNLAGLAGSNFIVGIGPVFIFVVIFPIYVLIHLGMKNLFKGEEKIDCIKRFIEPKAFVNIFIVFMLEGCIELGLTCGVCLMLVSNFIVTNKI